MSLILSLCPRSGEINFFKKLVLGEGGELNPFLPGAELD